MHLSSVEKLSPAKASRRSPVSPSPHSSSDLRCLLLATVDGTHGVRSGYTAISNYLPEARLIHAPRTEPAGIAQRICTKVLTRFTASRWCRGASLSVERQARHIVRSGFHGVIHILWGDRDWAFLDCAAKKGAFKLCATFHACPDTLPEIFPSTHRLRRLDAIILMSEVQRHFFESRGVDSERIHVIHHGVDCSFFKPAERASDSPFTVISVGNYRRNFALLREVCERLAATSGIRIRIVAPGSKQSLFAGLGNVDFVSNVSDEELLSLYQQASCMLMTIDAATANNAILEALACGVPIVSEDVGGIAEYTGHAAAQLHPAGNAEALAASILCLQANPALRHSMSSAARARALELDWPVVARKTAAIYQGLIA